MLPLRRPALLLTCVLLAACTRTTALPAAQPPTVLVRADCGGRQVVAQGTPYATGVPIPGTHPAYARLQVLGPGGEVLLDLTQDSGYRGAVFTKPGSTDPLLIVQQAAAESSYLYAYRCTQQDLAPVAWEANDRVPGTVAGANDQELDVTLARNTGVVVYPVLYRYEGGSLRAHLHPKSRTHMQVRDSVDLGPGLQLQAWTLPEQMQPVLGGPLLVTDKDGRPLLERPLGVARVAGVWDVGAPYPVLVVAQLPTDAAYPEQHYLAYLYDPTGPLFRQLRWGEREYGGTKAVIRHQDRSLRLVDQTGGICSRDPASKDSYTLWRYQDGALMPVSSGTAEADNVGPDGVSPRCFIIQ